MVSETTRALGPQIAAMRHLRGLSQRELARRIRTSHSALHAYECGTRDMSIIMLWRLVNVLQARAIINDQDESISFIPDDGSGPGGITITPKE